MDDQSEDRGRRGSQQLELLANSALLKVLQYLVTAVALPLLFWAINVVVNRLENIETAINAGRTVAATNELRMQRLERDISESNIAIKGLIDQAIRHEYDIRRLSDRDQDRRSKPN